MHLIFSSTNNTLIHSFITCYILPDSTSNLAPIIQHPNCALQQFPSDMPWLCFVSDQLLFEAFISGITTYLHSFYSVYSALLRVFKLTHLAFC